MANLTLTILSPSGTEFHIETPDDLSIQELIRELLVGLALPSSTHDGRQIQYRLDSKTQGKTLSPSDTLATSGVATGDTLILTVATLAGGGPEQEKSRISIVESSIGLTLDDLASVDVKTLLSNEPALMMTLHSYRTALSQLDDLRQDLRSANKTIEALLDKLKEKKHRNCSADFGSNPTWLRHKSGDESFHGRLVHISLRTGYGLRRVIFFILWHA